MNILGLSAFYHDSAACLVRDGEIVAAAQEERFTRRKQDADFPKNAVSYCLKAAGLTSGSQLDFVAFYEKPFLKLDRLFSSHLAVAPRGLPAFLKAIPVWIKQKIWIKEMIRRELNFEGEILFPEHHESHAASAFFPSPFERAAILTIDGVGEWTTTSVGRGEANRVTLLAEQHFPHSLGLLYSAFTQHLGFRVNSGEYKVMGLAPFGEPRFRDQIFEELIDLKPDGSFRLNLRYFDFLAGLRMTNHAFENLFGAPRKPEAELTQTHMDLARSLQAVTEESMLTLTRHARELTTEKNLCLAGGVALNCVGNGRILREKIFDDIWIQPAAGDAGGALGAALVAWHHHCDQSRKISDGRDSQKASLLGPSFDSVEFLQREKIKHLQLADNDLFDRVAALIDAGNVVGWFQDRMEFGPRALGNRSILADARSPEMQAKLNLKIKFREGFRPFAPIVLLQRVADYFELDRASPYMLLVAPVAEKIRMRESRIRSSDNLLSRVKIPRSEIPAVTHVDFSARIQTVAATDNPRLHALLRAFEKRTSCGVLVNTSFNVRGEPPVCTPRDAYRCFMRTGMDFLVLGNCLVAKSEQPAFIEPSSNTKPRWPNESIDNSPAALRKFGLILAAAFLVIGIFKRSLLAGAVGLILALLAIVAPRALRQFHRGWMIFAEALGWLMTRVILTIVFFVVLVPMGIIQRLFAKPALDLRFRGAEESNWIAREPLVRPADYTRQF